MRLRLLRHYACLWLLPIVLLAACQPPAAPAATLAPTASAVPSATATLPPPTPAPTDTDIATATETATPSPSPSEPIPTADFTPADFQAVWHRFDVDRGDLYLTFRADGTYSAAHGTTYAQVHGGTYTLEGRLFTFTTGWNCSPMEGTVVGSYLIKLVGNGQFLYFERHGDVCPDRPQSLANLRWTRVLETPTPMP